MIELVNSTIIAISKTISCAASPAQGDVLLPTWSKVVDLRHYLVTESSREFVKTQMVVPTLRVPESVDLGWV